MRGIEDANPGLWVKCVHCDSQILKTENKVKINEEFENLSKTCIETEKAQNESLQKIIEKINNESKINNIEL